MNSDDFEQGRTAVRERITTPDFSAVEAMGRRASGTSDICGWIPQLFGNWNQ
jgi:hypothetical protein